MLLNCGVGEDSWESLGLQGDPTSPSYRRPVLGVHWKDWCWGWNSNTLATSCEELTDWKRPWCWEGLRAGGEGDDRGWDGWMASPTQWTWVWVDSRNWWWIGRPGVLRFMGLQRVGHDWAAELNWNLAFKSSRVATPLPLAKNPLQGCVCVHAHCSWSGSGVGYEGVACALGRAESVERRGLFTNWLTSVEDQRSSRHCVKCFPHVLFNLCQKPLL